MGTVVGAHLRHTGWILTGLVVGIFLLFVSRSSTPSSSPLYDVLVVPGGGRVLEDGTPPPLTQARLDKALEVVRELDKGPEFSKPFLLVLSGGTAHKPNLLDSEGCAVWEATASASYLIQRGVDPSRIVREWTSYDTIGNAAFARLMHTDVRGWRRLLVITNQFHMDRVQAIFSWVFALPPVPSPSSYHLSFCAVPDRGLSDTALAKRRGREQESLVALRAIMSRVTNLEALHRFLFTEHDCYRTSGVVKKVQDPSILESY